MREEFRLIQSQRITWLGVQNYSPQSNERRRRSATLTGWIPFSAHPFFRLYDRRFFAMGKSVMEEGYVSWHQCRTRRRFSLIRHHENNSRKERRKSGRPPCGIGYILSSG